MCLRVTASLLEDVSGCCTEGGGGGRAVEVYSMRVWG